MDVRCVTLEVVRWPRHIINTIMPPTYDPISAMPRYIRLWMNWIPAESIFSTMKVNC